ncbi:MAG: Crp/Fnr family transcriptional regulator [Actinomycetota bacterium]|nr:Crp/Fnr family transcriptional regulator [Actinomycetota bacterium]
MSCEPARSSGPVAFGFLGKLTADEVTALRASGRERTYGRGAALFFEGERSQTVAIVLRGRVKVSSLSSDGHETVLAFRSPGDLLGELSVLDGGPRSASVTAAEPVEALIVSGSRFRELLAARPRIAIVLLETLTRRLRDADRTRLEYGAYDTVGRVSRRLVELAADHGVDEATGVRITLPLSQGELAGWTGASRESVARALAILRRDGIISTDRRRIVVTDMEALRRTVT